MSDAENVDYWHQRFLDAGRHENEQRLRAEAAERDRALDRHAFEETVKEMEKALAASRAHAAANQKDSDEMNALFDRMWAADMRGIKMWQKAHPGKELVWPDKGKLVEWLLDRIVDLEDSLKDAI